jgi:hypothetical protein
MFLWHPIRISAKTPPKSLTVFLTPALYTYSGTKPRMLPWQFITSLPIQYLLNNPTIRRCSASDEQFCEPHMNIDTVQMFVQFTLRYFDIYWRSSDLSLVSDKRGWHFVADQSGFFRLSEILAWHICIKHHRTNCNEYQCQLSSEDRAGRNCSTADGLSLSVWVSPRTRGNDDSLQGSKCRTADSLQRSKCWTADILQRSVQASYWVPYCCTPRELRQDLAGDRADVSMMDPLGH